MERLLNQSYGVISWHIMPLVITSLGGGHTGAQTHTHFVDKINFWESGTPAAGQCMLGYKVRNKK